MNATKVTSYGFALWLVSRGAAPLTIERVPGTSQRVFTFDAELVEQHRPSFRRATAILALNHEVPATHNPAPENPHAIDQSSLR